HTSARIKAGPTDPVSFMRVCRAYRGNPASPWRLPVDRFVAGVGIEDLDLKPHGAGSRFYVFQHGLGICSIDGMRAVAGTNSRRIASRTAPKGGQFVLHAKALHGNPYDGHTLGPVIADLEKFTDVTVRRIHGDKSYRGHNCPNRFYDALGNLV